MEYEVTILISEADLLGNKGAVAMASCLMEGLKSKFPNARFILTTRFYDAAEGDNIKKDYNVQEIVDISKERMERSLFRLFLWWLLKKIGVDLKFLLNTKIIKEYMKADVILSVSGISFIEDLGLIKV